MLDTATKIVTIGGVNTLADRLEWIVANRDFVSLRRLSMAAGLSHSTLSNAVKREREGGEANLAMTSLAAVAKVARVPVDWLVNGGPPPDAPARVLVPYNVVRKLVEDGYADRAARRAVGDVAFQEGAEGISELDLYRAALRVLEAERGKAVGDTPVGDDEC